MGWNTTSTGSGTTYQPDSSITPTASLTLYAYWLPNCAPTTSYGGGNQVMTFASGSSCAYTVPAGVTSIDVLVVGGGGVVVFSLMVLIVQGVDIASWLVD